jgi:oxygen-dependent protoporphyrinogen oxidase
VAAVRDHGSLVAGLRSQLATATAVDAPVFYGLRGGMQTLVDALARDIVERGARVLLGTRAIGVEQRDDPTDAGVRIVTRAASADHTEPLSSAPVDADAAVLTTPDAVTAALLAPIAPDVASDLNAVTYASVALVLLAVPEDAVDAPLEGTGFLVPEQEGLLLTACSYASSKWAHLTGTNRAPIVLRASAGRSNDDRPFALADDTLVDAVVADLGRTMGLRGDPLAWHVSRWPRALPQFEPGHLERVQSWRTRLADVAPRVQLAGAGIEGLGIPACIRQGRAAAQSIRAALG